MTKANDTALNNSKIKEKNAARKQAKLAKKQAKIDKQNSSFFRPKAVPALILLLVLVWFFFAFCLNPLISLSLENAFEQVTGAQVDIDQLNFDLPNLTFTIGRFQLTNPNDTKRNLFETHDFKAQLLPRPLFSGKVVVEEISVDKLLLNTVRAKDGAIIKPKSQSKTNENKLLSTAQAKLHQQIGNIPLLNADQLKANFDPDKLLGTYEPQTKQAAAQLQTRIKNTKENWQTAFDSDNSIKSRIAALKQNIQNFRFSDSDQVAILQQQLKDLKALSDEAKAIETDLSSTAANFQQDLKQLKAEKTSLNNIADQDLQTLLELAKLPDLGDFNYTAALFGDSLYNQSTLILKLVDQVRTNLPTNSTAKTKKAKPRRGGQNISFPGQATYPRFLIKRITVADAETLPNGSRGYAAQGEITGITSEPYLYGKPLTANLAGIATNNTRLHLSTKLDLTQGINGNSVLKIQQLPLTETNLSDNPYLPSKLQSGLADLQTKVDFSADNFKLDINLAGKNLISDYSGKSAPTDLGMEVIRQVLSQIDSLNINYSLQGNNDNLQMKLSSDLDRLLKERLQAIAGAEVTAATNKLRDSLNQTLATETAKINVLLSNYEADSQSQLNQLKNTIEHEKQKLKQRQEKLEQQLKDDLASEILKKLNR